MKHKEYYDISNNLVNYHTLFYEFWKLGYPSFTKIIPTAAVTFDKEGSFFSYLFNPDYWDSLDNYNKLFVICHECLHVAFEHGKRSISCKKSDRGIFNIAADIVVNESLVQMFGFIRQDIQKHKDYYWYDTVFTDPTITVLPDQSFEYYFNLLKKNADKIRGNLTLPDDHSEFLFEDLPQELQDLIQETIKSNQELIDKINKEAGKNPKEAYKLIPETPKIPKKKKWESVIKKYVRKALAEFVFKESWIKTNRRMGCINSKFVLPSNQFEDNFIKNKINMWFFQDTSGSCEHLAERFFKAAMSIPTEHINIKLFCFDTKVYSVDPKTKKLYGFGGTSFSCIEQYIQNTIQQSNTGYPDAVFIITDGEGNHVIPKHSERWYWFLSQNYKNYIPTRSHCFMLEDFE